MISRHYDSAAKNYYGDIFDIFRVFDESCFSPKTQRAKSSAYRVESDEESLTLSIDIPGVKLADLTVEVVGTQIKVSGKLREEEFKYLYSISKKYNPENPDATLENGVLTLRFSKNVSDVKSIKINAK